MTATSVIYVEQTPEGSWRVAGSRVSLDSIVAAYWDGRSAEAIVADFPSLSLEQVHGAIAFYLHHRAELDRHFEAQAQRWEQGRMDSETRNTEILRRLRSVRSNTESASNQEHPK